MMKRRTPIQMIIPVSTQHYNSHLENNDGKQDDNIDIKKDRVHHSLLG